MSYISGQVYSAVPATDLVTAIEAGLTAHAAWTLDDTVVAGGLTNRIWRCESTHNVIATNFYVIIAYPTVGTGSVRVKVIETWTAASDTGTKPAGSPAATTPAADYSQGTTARSADETSNTAYASLTTSAAGVEYWAVISNSWLWIASRANNGVDDSAFVGCFDSFLSSVNDPMPLVMFSSNPAGAISSQAGGAFTRHPFRTAASADNWAADMQNFHASAAGSFTPGAGQVDQYHNAFPLGRVLVSSESGSGVANFGAFRGLMYDTLSLWTSAGAKNGDYFEVGADTYRVMVSAIGPGIYVAVKESATS